MKTDDQKIRETVGKIDGYWVPKVGDKIYVATHLYIDHGEDDVVGGLATVTKVQKYNGSNVMLSVEEHPGHSYNWKVLFEDQEELKEEFGQQAAYADPDLG